MSSPGTPGNDPKGNASSSTGPAHAPAASPAPAPMAPSIPNLLSRIGPPRAGRGGRRGGRAHHMPSPGEYDSPPSYLYPSRPGGFGGFGSGPGPRSVGMSAPSAPPARTNSATPTPSQRTATIQSTDTDAALSRLSAVDVGLLEDPFAQFFAGDGGGPAPRRLPIINRGTYTRTKALDKMIGAFLAGGRPGARRQIVSLGAGTDTRALRLLAGTNMCYANVAYHEIDFPRVGERKRAIVQAVPEIRALLAGPVTQHTPTSWSVGLGDGSTLYSHGYDLREFKDEEKEGPSLVGFEPGVPTLVVSECCLCYLQPDEAVSVLRYFVEASALSLGTLSTIGAVIYEPIHPNDSFGRTMVSNLAARGIEMPTLAACPDGASHDARLTQQVGLADKADHRTIEQIWDAWVPAAEKARVNAMEGLDEVEEWKLLASHYVVAWGYRGDHFKGLWDQLNAAPEDEQL